MPKERTIPGYFDDIEGFSESYYAGREPAVESPAPAPSTIGEKDVMKGKSERSRKKKKTLQPTSRPMASRAFISEDLNMMLGLYKMRVRHIWSTSRSYGEILEDAFCHYLKSHDREAYDEFVMKGLIKK